MIERLGGTRPVFWTGVLGLVASSGAVLCAGRIGPPGWADTFTSWLGLWNPTGIIADLDPWPGRLLAVALVVLVITWAGVVRGARTGAVSARQVWALGGLWSLPLLIGPPILSNDVYSYVAQGAVSASGADPSTVTPFGLGWASPLLRAVDPMWRSTVSPYGPAATVLERWSFELAHGHPVLVVVFWRLVAALSVAVTGAVAMSFVTDEHVVAGGRARRRAVVAALTVANPLLLLHVVAAGHLDGVMVCVLLVALRVATIPGRSAALVAVALATTSAAFKAPAAVVVAIVALARILATRRNVADRLAALAGTAVVVAVVWGAWTALAGSGLHVLAVVETPSLGRTLAAPSTLAADVLSPLLGASAGEGGDLLWLARVIVAVAGLGLVARLLVTADRRPATPTAGAALLTAAFAAPVLYPWYLTWSVPLLAIHARGRDVQRLTLLSGLGAVMAIQGLTRVDTEVVVTVVMVSAVCWTVHQEKYDRCVAASVSRYLAGRVDHAST